MSCFVLVGEYLPRPLLTSSLLWDILQLNKQNIADGGTLKMLRGGSDLLEDSPALLKEKVLRLQAENEALKKRSSTSADGDAYKGRFTLYHSSVDRRRCFENHHLHLSSTELHDDLKKLQEETEQKLRAANMKILELESSNAESSVVCDLNEKVADPFLIPYLKPVHKTDRLLTWIPFATRNSGRCRG